jgi:hypothetical protein
MVPRTKSGCPRSPRREPRECGSLPVDPTRLPSACASGFKANGRHAGWQYEKKVAGTICLFVLRPPVAADHVFAIAFCGHQPSRETQPMKSFAVFVFVTTLLAAVAGGVSVAMAEKPSPDPAPMGDPAVEGNRDGSEFRHARFSGERIYSLPSPFSYNRRHGCILHHRPGVPGVRGCVS